MKKFKAFLRNNLWVFVALVDVVMLLMFFYMVFGWIMEIADFHTIMANIAG